MRLVSFERGGTVGFGIAVGDSVVDLGARLAGRASSLKGLLERDLVAEAAADRRQLRQGKAGRCVVAGDLAFDPGHEAAQLAGAEVAVEIAAAQARQRVRVHDVAADHRAAAA